MNFFKPIHFIKCHFHFLKDFLRLKNGLLVSMDVAEKGFRAGIFFVRVIGKKFLELGWSKVWNRVGHFP
jgi:hypothetical protein